MTKSTLLVSCKDQKGIVAGVSQLLHRSGANILHADQHTDLEAGIFFQRVQFEGAELNPESFEATFSPLAEEFDMSWRLAVEDRRRRVALFVSKVDHCLYDLLLRQRAGELDCQISVVVSNHETLRSVAEQFDIPFHWLPITATTKREQERRQLDLLANHDVDLVVLARYMQILSDDFLSHYPNRVINIHHSFLPAFIGGKPYHQAYRRGVKLVGATAHYATPDLDEGPIIEQDVARCSHRDSVRDLVRKGRDLERSVLGRAVRCHLEDRVLVYGNKTVVFD